MTAPPLSGFVAPGFEKVRDALAASFAAGEDLGANVAVFLGGERVVDLVGGHLDRGREIPWTDRTLARVYSSGKAIVAMLIARAVSDGALDYGAPVMGWWPEFGAAGKEEITLADVLSHQAGLCAIAEEMPAAEWLEWGAIIARIERMAPLAPPRERSAYGPQTFGHIASEILRRATGRGIRTTLQADFHDAHGVEAWCGLPDKEHQRVAPMQKPPRAPDYGEMNRLTELAFLKAWSAPSKIAPDALLRADIPASNIYCNARALAELVQPFADRGRFRGARVIEEAVVAAALKERIRGQDLVLPFEMAWAAGVNRNLLGHYGPSPTAYGHAGWGGSAVMFDPQSGLSAAYVMNKMSEHLSGDPRAVRIFTAAAACV